MEAAGEAALEVFSLQRLPVRAGFAPSGHRTSLLPGGSVDVRDPRAGPGDGWRGGPGPDPSVAVAAPAFLMCARIFVMTLLSVMTATIRIVAPHAREQRVDLVDAADQRGPALPELPHVRSYRARRQP